MSDNLIKLDASETVRGLGPVSHPTVGTQAAPLDPLSLEEEGIPFPTIDVLDFSFSNFSAPSNANLPKCKSPVATSVSSRAAYCRNLPTLPLVPPLGPLEHDSANFRPCGAIMTSA